jgi:uncharacterized protein (TIGR00661 family)
VNILYALQATGNGHICRAQKIIPELKKYCNVHVLISGSESDINLGLKVDYSYHGFSYVFGKTGGIDWIKSILRNNLFRLLREIRNVPVQKYDLVINDFEPLTAWACKRRKIKCIAMSHQYALLLNTPKPKNTPIYANWILKNYAPVSDGIGFHFKKYSKKTFLPIIRNSILDKSPVNQNFFVVYLPAICDKKISNVLRKICKNKWFVFSKHCDKPYRIENVNVFPPSDTEFQNLLSKCEGVLCGAGFETPSEALYLGKKLMVVPMKNQFEQHYNAEALRELGVHVLKNFSKNSVKTLQKWCDEKNTSYDYKIADEIQAPINHIVKKFIKTDN